ncbi:MAG: hypothetical protein RL112_2717 [Planctomycetota bacterium]
MALRIQLLLAACCALLLCAASFAAHLPRAGQAHDDDRAARREASPSAEALAKARAKWETLSSERRAELMEAWRKLQELSPEERAKLVERAERLKRMREELVQRLSAEERARLATLPPEQREHALRGLAHAAGRERGARLKERLPDAWRAEFEALTPEQRAERMARFHAGLAERGLRLVVDKVAERLSSPREELERLQALPVEQRERELRAMLARLTPDEARKLGWKADTLEERAALQATSVKDLAAAYMSSRLERELRGKGHSEERVQALLRLSRALEPRHEEWASVRELPEAERRAALDERRRARTVEALAQSGLVDPARLQALAALRGPEAMSEARRLLEELGLPQRRGGRGRGGPDGKEHGHDERWPGDRFRPERDGKERDAKDRDGKPRESSPGIERRPDEDSRAGGR